VAEAAEAARVVSGSAALRDAQAASALAQLDTCARALCKLAPLPQKQQAADPTAPMRTAQAKAAAEALRDCFAATLRVALPLLPRGEPEAALLLRWAEEVQRRKKCAKRTH
jgi:hypothetical protein